VPHVQSCGSGSSTRASSLWLTVAGLLIVLAPLAGDDETAWGTPAAWVSTEVRSSSTLRLAIYDKTRHIEINIYILRTYLF
jgi:hypothetical protein